jgi:hypothetical protein
VLPPVADWLGGMLRRAVDADLPVDPGFRILDFRPEGKAHAPRVRSAQGQEPRQDRGAPGVPRDMGEDAARLASPTALARLLVAEGADDDVIMATCNRYFKAGSPDIVKQVQFVRNDLQRLRARLDGGATVKARAGGPRVRTLAPAPDYETVSPEEHARRCAERQSTEDKARAIGQLEAL